LWLQADRGRSLGAAQIKPITCCNSPTLSHVAQSVALKRMQQNGIGCIVLS
jgi:hypothetical protein